MRRIALFSLLFVALACRTDKDPLPDTSLPGADSPGGADSDGLVDADGDGYYVQDDCDDTNSAISPSATELCNGLDDNCDGDVDGDAADASTWYLDGDSDGYGDSRITELSCEAPVGYVAQAEDCDDEDAAFHPGASEDDCLDPNDYNCDGSVGYADDDDDGFAACEECDDTRRAVNPSAAELCDSIDNDCDGTIDVGAKDSLTIYQDLDGDGYGDPDYSARSCELGAGYALSDDDCDDTDASIHPDAEEICDDTDQDCDGDIDDDATDTSTWYADTDKDGYGNPDYSRNTCDAPKGYVSNSGDCDDTEALAWTGATEVCDEVDNDCDGDTDEGVTSSWTLDYDGDGYGRDSSAVDACDAPSAYYTATGGDCDDTAGDVYPGATPGCDGEDYDCDGLVDNDADLDGYADASCGGDDCDDSDSSVLPEAGGGCALGTSCLDLLNNRGITTDGVYTIDTDGFGAGDDPQDVYCDQTTDGGGWTRVYYEDSRVGFFAVGQSEYNRGSPTSSLYAILDDLEYFRRSGELEFLMRWPGHTTYTSNMQWAQTSNPVTDTAGATPTGYRAISIPYTSNGWSAGLQRSAVGTYSLLDGTMSPLTNWYYAVGTTYCWGSTTTGCQPAPSGGAHVAELLIR